MSGVVYAFNLWPSDDSPDPGFVPSALAPCAGWSEWESRWPDTSVLFPIHWAILDRKQLSKDEYGEWLDLVRDQREEMEDAGASPYVLQEYTKQAGQWLAVMDQLLYDLYRRGEVDPAAADLEYKLLNSNADQMGIEWGNAILECPPSDRR